MNRLRIKSSENWDIIGLSEVRKFGEAIIELSEGELFSYISKTKGQNVFMIKKELKYCIKEINGISERITVLTLMINRTSINIIQVYAPTEASMEEDIIEFYNLLYDTLNNYKARRTFVMGDFISKIGHRDYGEEEVMGLHGFGVRYERGDKLTQFAQGQRLKMRR